MDLPTTVQQMRVDAVMLAVHASLTNAHVSHVFLKGPTTSFWLYDPPRTYIDVDVLVAPGSAVAAARALAQSGVAQPGRGRPGEEASHAHVLVSPHGVEVDLHLALPLVSARQAAAQWPLLLGQVQDFTLSNHVIPALSLPARGVVLALHALGGGLANEKAQEDLRRARELPPSYWAEVALMAEELRVAGLVDAAVGLQTGALDVATLPRDIRLLATGAPAAAVQLARLAELPWYQVPRALLRELVPSAGFMRSSQELGDRHPVLLIAYLKRWARLLRTLPTAIRRLR